MILMTLTDDSVFKIEELSVFKIEELSTIKGKEKPLLANLEFTDATNS